MKFVDLLGPNGFLFIGHSERISGPADEKLRGRGITTYEKEKR
jgi:chemotaxis protein methyltransferase CheR